MTTGTLPKYIQNANRIIDVLSEQPDKIWKGTQRELCGVLDISQPELSNLISTLAEAGKVRKGNPLPGVRGRNYALELVDGTHLTTALPRRGRAQQDRPLQPGEAIQGPIELQSLSLDQVGAAVIRTLHSTWEKAERASHYQAEQMARIKDMREQLTQERQYRTRYATEKENLERQIEERDAQIAKMREQINALVIKLNGRQENNRGGVPVKDLLDADEMRMLNSLLTQKPGFYRESDEEVGLKAG